MTTRSTVYWTPFVLFAAAVGVSCAGPEESIQEDFVQENVATSNDALTSVGLDRPEAIPPEIALSNPTAWGVVTLTEDKIGSVYTVKNVGGGTWNYGRSGNHCWSHYVHNSKYHSATAIQGSVNTKVFENATYWANADIYNGSGTCNAYWSTY